MTHGFAPNDGGGSRRFRVHRPARTTSRRPRPVEPPHASGDPGCKRFRANGRRYAPGGEWLASAVILVVAAMMALVTAFER